MNCFVEESMECVIQIGMIFAFRDKTEMKICYIAIFLMGVFLFSFLLWYNTCCICALFVVIFFRGESLCFDQQCRFDFCWLNSVLNEIISLIFLL